MGGDQLSQASGGDYGGVVPELHADALDDPIHLAREAVDEPGLEGGDRRLSDHGLGLDEVDLGQTGCAREERVHGDFDAGREDTTDVLPLRRDGVEVRRGPEVDDDAGRAVAFSGSYRIGDPVRADLARIVVEDGDPGACP